LRHLRVGEHGVAHQGGLGSNVFVLKGCHVWGHHLNRLLLRRITSGDNVGGYGRRVGSCFSCSGSGGFSCFLIELFNFDLLFKLGISSVLSNLFEA